MPWSWPEKGSLGTARLGEESKGKREDKKQRWGERERKRLGPETKLRWAWLQGKRGSSLKSGQRRMVTEIWEQWREDRQGRTALQEQDPRSRCPGATGGWSSWPTSCLRGQKRGPTTCAHTPPCTSSLIHPGSQADAHWTHSEGLKSTEP